MESKFQIELVQAINNYLTSFKCLNDTGAKEVLDSVMRRACDIEALKLCADFAASHVSTSDSPARTPAEEAAFWIERVEKGEYE